VIDGRLVFRRPSAQTATASGWLLKAGRSIDLQRGSSLDLANLRLFLFAGQSL